MALLLIAFPPVLSAASLPPLYLRRRSAPKTSPSSAISTFRLVAARTAAAALLPCEVSFGCLSSSSSPNPYPPSLPTHPRFFLSRECYISSLTSTDSKCVSLKPGRSTQVPQLQGSFIKMVYVCCPSPFCHVTFIPQRKQPLSSELGT